MSRYKVRYLVMIGFLLALPAGTCGVAPIDRTRRCPYHHFLTQAEPPQRVNASELGTTGAIYRHRVVGSVDILRRFDQHI